MSTNRIARTIVGIAFTIWAAGLSPLPAAEKSQGYRFSLTPFAGYYGTVRLAALIPLPQTADVPSIKVLLEQSAPEGGLSLGYALNRRFELQFSVSTSGVRIMNDIGIGIGGGPIGKRKATDASLRNLGLRLLYDFELGKISPYIAAGFGASILDPEAYGTRTRPSFELGAGARIRLSHRLRAGLEVRDVISTIHYFGDFGIGYLAIYSAEEHHIQHRPGARLSLGYLF